MSRDKVRIRFRKDGDLRFLSHHDLMRTLERMLRRAGLPFRSTEGFHPKPRMAFASALGLGIIGHAEAVEIEFDGPVDPDEVRRRLAAQAPPGLTILAARRIDPRATAQVTQASYFVPLPADRPADLPRRVADLLAQEACWVTRTRPQPKQVNIRPYLLGLTLGEQGLTMDLRVTPGGTARPEEVLQALGLGDLLAAGAILERTALVLADETNESAVHGPRATGHPDSAHLSGVVHGEQPEPEDSGLRTH
jgi:radical SAM-linked protein